MIKFTLFAKSVVVTLESKTFTISKDDKRFPFIRSLIEQDRVQEIATVADPERFRAFQELKARLMNRVSGQAV